MERGIAKIVFGFGTILTDVEPSPVDFDPHTFSHVVHGSDVFFVRSASDPAVAVNVVLASDLETLVALATPPAGFAEDAEPLVVERAARLLAEAQFAPTRAQATAHIAFAKERMSAISAGLCGADEPADRGSLKKLL